MHEANTALLDILVDNSVIRPANINGMFYLSSRERFAKNPGNFFLLARA